MHMAIAKELFTFCFEPYCKCDPVNEYATCPGLDFVPKIPHFVHNLILTYSNFSEVNVSRQFLSKATENDLKSLIFISNSITLFTNDVFVYLTSLSSLTISGEIILSVQSLQNPLYGLNTTLKSIKLEDNSWYYLPYNIFSAPSLNNIRNISLAKNAISSLSLTLFEGLHNLQLYNDLDMILHGFMLQIITYATVFRVKRLSNIMLRVRLFHRLTRKIVV